MYPRMEPEDSGQKQLSASANWQAQSEFQLLPQIAVRFLLLSSLKEVLIEYYFC